MEAAVIRNDRDEKSARRKRKDLSYREQPTEMKKTRKKLRSSQEAPAEDNENDSYVDLPTRAPVAADKPVPPSAVDGNEADATEDRADGEGNEATGVGGGHKKVISQKKLAKIREDYANRGVVYLSRIPPHMKPNKLRQLLAQYGEITRVYLAPEDPRTRLRRKKAGRDTGKNFVEGWVEFAKKKVAKRVAAMLNNNPMGGKKRSAYCFDLWNIKYLKGFVWDTLTEEIALRNAVREQRIAAEVSAAKRERDTYLSRVDQARAVEAMEARRAAKAPPVERAAEPGEGGVAQPSALRVGGQKKLTARQRQPVEGPMSQSAPIVSDQVLSKVRAGSWQQIRRGGANCRWLRWCGRFLGGWYLSCSAPPALVLCASRNNKEVSACVFRVHRSLSGTAGGGRSCAF
eukprot:jgi/Mesvir1/1872/Mv22907-RA.1